MTAAERPTWQTDDCPSWCVTVHLETDLPDDRFHDSAPTYVPVIVGPPAASGELLVITSRRCGTTDDWTFIGHPDQGDRGVTLSPESARRLAGVLLISL